MRDRIKIRGKVTATVLEFNEKGRLAWEKIVKADIPGDEKDRIVKKICKDRENLQIKRDDPNWLQKLLKIPGRPMISVTHNIVTDIGDAMVADILQETPERKKLNASNGHIIVGTGWTGSSPKANTGLNTQVSTPQDLDGGPVTKGAWGAANDNVCVWSATIAAGQCTSDGLDEAGLINNSATDTFDLFAFAEISPAVNKDSGDTLAVTWEITFVGA
jgi:hypothetical protein